MADDDKTQIYLPACNTAGEQGDALMFRGNFAKR